jgi:hypothetical protein
MRHGTPSSIGGNVQTFGVQMGMFTYRIATDEERTEKIPFKFREQHAAAYAANRNYPVHPFGWECRYICGEYMLCAWPDGEPMDGFSWAAARLVSGEFEFIIGDYILGGDEYYCAMECAIKLHEVLLAAGIVNNSECNDPAHEGIDDDDVLCVCGISNCKKSNRRCDFGK